MKKIILKCFIYLMALALFVGTIFLLVFAKQKQEATRIKEVRIQIARSGKAVYLQASDLGDYLNVARMNPSGKTKRDLNIAGLERYIEMNPYVKEAQVFMGNDDCLQIRVIQRDPVLKVINIRGDIFQIDGEGVLMPLNSEYTRRLRVCNGDIRLKPAYGLDILKRDSLQQVKMLKNAFAISQYMDGDKILDALIGQIYILPNGEYELYPCIGGQIIEFGTAEDMASKFQRLKLFYLYGMSKKTWNEYKSISLKYKNQVVCTKK